MKTLVYFCVVFACIQASLSLETVREEDITYVFYSREIPNGVHTTIKDVSDVRHIRQIFNAKKPTIVLIHGFKDGYGADSNTYVRNAILSSINANIIKVDWSPLAGQNYLVARNAVPSVGRYTAKLLRKVFDEFNYSLKNLTVVGFSLGAHAAGNVGKELNGKVAQIVGLDPAGPFISSQDLEYSLHPSDAVYVQAVHTNGGILGTTDAVGHSDFWPNGGSRQPGCGTDLLGGCAHNRAWEYFAESVVNNGFWARKCASYSQFTGNECQNGERRIMGGLTLDREARGIFYLDTNSNTPYARG